MSICESIVRRLGGKIEVESTLGKGTTIRVSFPVEMLPPTIASVSNQSTALKNVTTSLPSTATGTAPPLGRFRYRVISDELATLFDPATPALLLAATPPFEKEGFEFDFKGAVEKSQVQPTRIALPARRMSEIGPVVDKPTEIIRILVADDNAVARNILSRLLLGKGYPFSQAENGEEAVAAFKKGFSIDHHFQLILMDLQMPKMVSSVPR